jgi:hypothetical protein|tara:strand:- start:1172 stop:1903 length:732 start_codon:yes stop_codon:yes gene_type:complete
MQKEEIIERLRNDEDYYGAFGRNYLSNSDIAVLKKDPLRLKEPSKQTTNFLIGSYFHTCILEPNKLKKYKIIESTTRNTKIYKELSNGELCLLQQEVDRIELMRDKVMKNKICKDFIQNENNEFEKPGIVELEGNFWKGKADIVNHDEKLIIDLKTTSDVDSFRSSAFRYNYDSQAYIYSKIFGYEFLFIIIDKSTHRIKIADCSPDFLESGKAKVEEATETYNLFYKTPEFDATQFFLTQTL